MCHDDTDLDDRVRARCGNNDDGGSSLSPVRLAPVIKVWDRRCDGTACYDIDILGWCYDDVRCCGSQSIGICDSISCNSGRSASTLRGSVGSVPTQCAGVGHGRSDMRVPSPLPNPALVQRRARTHEPPPDRGYRAADPCLCSCSWMPHYGCEQHAIRARMLASYPSASAAVAASGWSGAAACDRGDSPLPPARLLRHKGNAPSAAPPVATMMITGALRARSGACLWTMHGWSID